MSLEKCKLYVEEFFSLLKQQRPPPARLATNRESHKIVQSIRCEFGGRSNVPVHVTEATTLLLLTPGQRYRFLTKLIFTLAGNSKHMNSSFLPIPNTPNMCSTDTFSNIIARLAYLVRPPFYQSTRLDLVGEQEQILH